MEQAKISNNRSTETVDVYSGGSCNLDTYKIKGKKIDESGQRYYQHVELFHEPRQQILPKLSLPKGEPEMSEFDSGFLCGMLKKYRPKRIMEVGLASGATSAIVMQCMHMLGEDYEMFSVDLAEQFFHDTSVKSGFLAEEAKKYIPGTNQKRYLGKLAVENMDEIGGEIDFLILDTIHVPPGEMLDFLSLLPFLTENAVVVLHDIRFNWQKEVRSDFRDAGWITKLILCTVTAEKYMQEIPTPSHRVPNIAAFVVNKATRRNIATCFDALSLTWYFVPSQEHLDIYRRIFEEYYPQECLWLYRAAVHINKSIANAKRISYTTEHLSLE